MPTFEVDDQLHSHPKAALAGDEALGLWVRLGSWCMAYLTDGRVPRGLPMLARKRKSIEKLIKVGLLSIQDDGLHYQMHDWLHWQKPASWWYEYRAKDAKKKQNRRAADRANSKMSPGDSLRESLGESPRSPSPSPSLIRSDPDLPDLGSSGSQSQCGVVTPRPTPTRKPNGKKSNGLRPLPADFSPSATTRDVADTEGRDWRDCLAAMRDWFAENPGKRMCVDWDARLRRWIRTASLRGECPAKDRSGEGDWQPPPDPPGTVYAGPDSPEAQEFFQSLDLFKKEHSA